MVEWDRFARRNDVSSTRSVADRTDPVGIINQWGAVLHDRVHDRPPTHPELGGDLRHRPRVLTHLATRLHPRRVITACAST
jgi:hypothetical protein